MNLQKDFKMVKQVLREQRWMYNKIQKQKKKSSFIHPIIYYPFSVFVFY